MIVHPRPKLNWVIELSLSFSGYVFKKNQLETLSKLIQSQIHLQSLRLIFKYRYISIFRPFKLDFPKRESFFPVNPTWIGANGLKILMVALRKLQRISCFSLEIESVYFSRIVDHFKGVLKSSQHVFGVESLRDLEAISKLTEMSSLHLVIQYQRKTTSSHRFSFDQLTECVSNEFPCIAWCAWVLHFESLYAPCFWMNEESLLWYWFLPSDHLALERESHVKDLWSFPRK